MLLEQHYQMSPKLLDHIKESFSTFYTKQRQSSFGIFSFTKFSRWIFCDVELIKSLLKIY